MSEEPPRQGSFEVFGEVEPECQDAIDFVEQVLRAKLDDQQMAMLRMYKIRFFKSDEDHGAHVDFEHKEIACNRDDAAMSLQESEDFLVGKGIIEPGDTTTLLRSIKDNPWSTLVSELVHEYGHVLDKNSGGAAYRRLDPSLSPTKYGSKESHEAFADAFRIWIFDGKLNDEAKKAVEDVVYRRGKIE